MGSKGDDDLMRYTYGTPYNEYLFNNVRGVTPEAVTENEGGYFAKPEPALDPRLFDGMHLKPTVRVWVLQQLYNFWNTRYNHALVWSTCWIAGSAVSLQWDALGADLDVLIGVNKTRFVTSNPQYNDMTEDDIDSMLTDELKLGLWPLTATYQPEPNADPMDVTYFVNAGSDDIRDIEPYAAYNLSLDEWTVQPVNPGPDWDPRAYFPQEWVNTVDTDVVQAHRLVDDYNGNVSTLSSASDVPSQMNALNNLHNSAQRAADYFVELHAGRKTSFEPGGGGYFGYGNFRWQMHAHSGTLKALHDIAVVNKSAHLYQQNELYGGQLKGPNDERREAGQAAWYERKLATQ